MPFTCVTFFFLTYSHLNTVVPLITTCNKTMQRRYLHTFRTCLKHCFRFKYSIHCAVAIFRFTHCGTNKRNILRCHYRNNYWKFIQPHNFCSTLQFYLIAHSTCFCGRLDVQVLPLSQWEEREMIRMVIRMYLMQILQILMNSVWQFTILYNHCDLKKKFEL